jgi:transglutaminase-like putative cysteine protease
MLAILMAGCQEAEQYVEPDSIVHVLEPNPELLQIDDGPQGEIYADVTVFEPSNIPMWATFEDYNNWTKDYPTRYKAADWSNDGIRAKAAELRGDNIETTIWNTHNFLQEIEWSFYEVRRGPDVTLKEMKGDCTDRSELGILLLRLNGIYARPAYGYITIDSTKHDWMEVLYPDIENKSVHWETIDSIPAEYLRKEGEGAW